MDRYSNGSYIVKDKVIGTYQLANLTSNTLNTIMPIEKSLKLTDFVVWLIPFVKNTE